MAKEIMGFDAQFLKQMKALFQETNIEEVEIAEGEDMYFRISRHKETLASTATAMPTVLSPVVSAVAPAVAPVATTQVRNEKAAPTASLYDDESKYFKIKSPIVGTFYDSPSPESPSFVKEGDVVSLDTTVAIVEAMKVMNEIKADVKGKIVRVFKARGSAVQSGEVLFIVEKS